MTDEKDAALCAKYPKIFSERNMSMQETCMCWGLDCGDGWYDLIDTLCCQLQSEVDQNPKQVQIIAKQVKQKYGTLRFDVGWASERIAGMVQMVEAISGRICEECGNKATVRTRGYVRNLCEPCHAESKKPKELK